ncbi:GD19921 [Drosophila simulans]|uniref:GD19921 n=1 Tax=Drosophila simulans TaxID=7240 RepID=B4NVF4_DROSI|nr:GD19921 [Drosophila simulans]
MRQSDRVRKEADRRSVSGRIFPGRVDSSSTSRSKQYHGGKALQEKRRRSSEISKEIM